MSQRLAAAILCIISLDAYAADDLSLLDSLADELRELRLSEPVSYLDPVKARCPEVTEPLLGLSKIQLLSALGNPDYEGSDYWTYFFTPPLIEKSIRGGGFPELVFSFESDDKVSHVECHYAR